MYSTSPHSPFASVLTVNGAHPYPASLVPIATPSCVLLGTYGSGNLLLIG
jgi:hypothetical protein